MIGIAILVGMTGCSPEGSLDPSAHNVALPGAGGDIDFDDVSYSTDLKRLLVPAREDGAYVVEPETAEATSVPDSGRADSVTSGKGVLFVLDRARRRIQLLRPDGRLMSSVTTAAGPDYIRYVASTGELWVSEPGGEGIEIFALGEAVQNAPVRVGFLSVPGGVEGLTLDSSGAVAFTHAGNDVVKIDVKTRAVVHRWASGCDGTHGFPRIDDRGRFLLASCASNGKVTLLDANDGHLIADYEVGGGESLPAYSSGPDHFYVRSDPGTKIATLQASPEGLKLVREVEVPSVGHCLGAEGIYYWTCDAKSGRVLRFEDG